MPFDPVCQVSNRSAELASQHGAESCLVSASVARLMVKGSEPVGTVASTARSE